MDSKLTGIPFDSINETWRVVAPDWSTVVYVENEYMQFYISGRFDSHEQRIAYAQEIARRLNVQPVGE